MRDTKAVNAKISFKVGIHVSRKKLLEQNLSVLFTSRARFTILVHFHGFEGQMCEWVPGVEKSPFRLDVLVWM